MLRFVGPWAKYDALAREQRAGIALVERHPGAGEARQALAEGDELQQMPSGRADEQHIHAGAAIVGWRYGLVAVLHGVRRCVAATGGVHELWLGLPGRMLLGAPA